MLRRFAAEKKAWLHWKFGFATGNAAGVCGRLLTDSSNLSVTGFLLRITFKRFLLKNLI